MSKDFIAESIVIISEDESLTNETYEKAIQTTLDSVKEFEQNNQEKMNEKLQEHEKASSNSIQVQNQIDYNMQIGTWKGLASSVDLLGCNGTARLMRHAVVPYEHVGETNWSPGIYVETNTAYARSAATSSIELNNEIYYKFYTEIVNNGLSSGTITGSFTFTRSNSSLDLAAGIHSANYSVTFGKKSNGSGYSASYSFTDVYDFEYMSDSSYPKPMEAANNLGYSLQEDGYIKPYFIVLRSNNH
ncbi:hypothetical protein [Enterococcus olivae]